MRRADSQARSGASSGSPTGAVKPRAHRREPPAGRAWVRHLEGWPLVPISVGIAVLAALVVVPRPIEPDVLPLPHVDRRIQCREALKERRRADLAEAEPLPFDVRATGELLRRYGAASAAGHDDGARIELARLRRAARRALATAGTRALLRLRAVQTRLFVKAVLDWSRTGTTTTEVAELGGNFVEHARKSGWVGADRRLVATRAELDVLFRLRWTEILGLADTKAFRPSLNDWRAYYRFLIEQPEFRISDPDPISLARRRLRYVEALARRDSEYPVDLARGALYFRLSEYPAAVKALRSHLVAHPDGDWTLRARNYLAAALERTAAQREN